uniref:Uncharacterized protein n=1 Tax=Candidatus Kentrum sp. UNK TaxID=2126344 RepID=A0A451AY19_9GAMM|nr:MAG: hypothetical protein BECKUNK1418H_GA0071006_103917 [Candidatus Kentron sp. UNK]
MFHLNGDRNLGGEVLRFDVEVQNLDEAVERFLLFICRPWRWKSRRHACRDDGGGVLSRNHQVICHWLLDFKAELQRIIRMHGFTCSVLYLPEELEA